MRRILIILFAAAFLLPAQTIAFSNDKKLPSAMDEGRAEDLFREIRCLVCTGESIAESNADLAGDLRRLVRKDITAGMSDRQIKDYIASRYGNQILLKPPFDASTFILWAFPFIFLGIGVFVIFFRGAKKR